MTATDTPSCYAATHAEVDRRMSLHSPAAEAGAVMDEVRAEFKALGHKLVDLLPTAAEAHDAVKLLGDALMHAIAALARPAAQAACSAAEDSSLTLTAATGGGCCKDQASA